MEKRDDIDIAIFDPEARTILRKEMQLWHRIQIMVKGRLAIKSCNNSIKFYKTKGSNIENYLQNNRGFQ